MSWLFWTQCSGDQHRMIRMSAMYRNHRTGQIDIAFVSDVPSWSRLKQSKECAHRIDTWHGVFVPEADALQNFVRSIRLAPHPPHHPSTLLPIPPFPSIRPKRHVFLWLRYHPAQGSRPRPWSSQGFLRELGSLRASRFG